MLKRFLLRNSVARRILISFLLAALIPVGILGYFSYKQVDSQLQDQVVTTLRKNCKNYALGLLDRIVSAESALKIISLNVKKSEKTSTLTSIDRESRLFQAFQQLVIIDKHRKLTPLRGTGEDIPEFTEEDIQTIGSGKTLFKFADSTGSNSNRFWLATKLIEHQSDSGILIAELKPEFLWDAENQEPNVLWILSEKGRLLFTSERNIDLAVDKAQILRTTSGQIAWKNGDEAYLGAYWKLPIKSIVAAPDLIIVQAQPKKLAFRAIEQFSTIYPPVIALAVLIVAYLSLRLIAKNLKPLERLKTATQRVSEGDFHYRLNIQTQDEFEVLADSFNEMTQQLQSQFDILSTMAEIDRHILSSLNAEDIVDTALIRLPGILHCDLISIARIDPETYRVSDIRTRLEERTIESAIADVKFSLHEVLELLEFQTAVIETTREGKFSAYFQHFNLDGDWGFLIVPIAVNGGLSSIIVLGFKAQHSFHREIVTAARNFGDRIAVALSNAAWEEKLYQQAHYDSLTGLPNRLVLHDRLAQELARARRDVSQLAVIFIDLDRFKNVNDSLGHSVGDELLIQVSRLFTGCVRETDLVVRLGGDEFVVVVTDLNNHINPMLLVTAIAEKINTTLKQTLMIAGHPMSFTASLGIAVFPRDGNDVQDLLKNADAAMYHAKNQGRDNFRFYSSELNASALENIKMEHELRGAIPKGEMRVYYQPKVDLTGQIVGAEALIRWQHAESGLISPAKFIPIAEQSGLIVDIGEWVLEQTCMFINSCSKEGIQPVRISVNLSVIEFKRPELVAKIAWILSKTGVDPQFIELELTESVAIGEAKACIDRMNDLKGLGLKLSMDDFGTGFSSLSYLKELPLDVLKIDQAFMRQLETEKNSQAIVKAILALANGLGMETVAEGVETMPQLEFLKNHDCGMFQGFLFSRPVTAIDFMKLLADKSIQRDMIGKS
ncbi:MAG: EAL domain-containing protein [Methylococcaceae bacterium]|nr:EAL domain-containing protein [Methylococcaceae bacterium]